jgi:hypothetical protein
MAEHPSADLLTAFSEHVLSKGENARIADHLSLCAECREAVFLASSVDDQPTAETKQATIQAVLRPRSRWMARVAWAGSAVATIAIAGGILIQQHRGHERSNQTLSQPAEVAQLPPTESKSDVWNSAALAPETKKPVRAPNAKSSEVAKSPRQSSDVLAKKSPPSDKEVAAEAGIPLAGAGNEPPEIVIEDAANSFKITVPTQNTFTERQESSQMRSFTPSPLPAGAPPTLMHQPNVMRTWRVTPDGQLEHFIQTGWTRVLADHSTKFQVVSESRNGVWAGGRGGELFHSEDGGEHWTEITLPIPPDGKSESIAAIHFADLQRGTIMTQSGVLYTTSDGGKSWTKQ